MDSALFDDLQQTLKTGGPNAAIERLCASLRDRKDYTNLFYALLLKKRQELGVPPVPTGSATELPPEVHADYEEAIRQAGRMVGKLYLDEGNIPQAWNFFRMLGEPEPVASALDKYQPGESEDCQQLVEIAFHQGANPRKGFDLILDRHGICSAITMMSGEFPFPSEVREYCTRRLVRSLHEQLRERLAAEVVRKEGTEPTATTVHELMTGRDWLFEEEFYHVDVSHLGAVVQMSIQLPRCEELTMARELCDYGKRLSSRLQYPGDPPFDDQYLDFGVYLAILDNDKVEEGLAHFRAKAENSDPQADGTFPAEVLINLLLKLERPAEALAVARKFLVGVDDRRLSCPSIADLCQRVNDYKPLVEIAREREDPVNYMAGLLAVNNSKH